MKFTQRERFVLPVDAEKVGNEIERLRKKNKGLVAPEQIVDAARPEDSVLHPCFEWDDSIAAEKYRLDQARYLIRAIVIVPEDGEKRKFDPVRAFVSVVADASKPSAGRVYTSMEDAMSDPLQRLRILEMARNELNSWRRRYQALEEFSSVFSAIDSMAS